MIISDAFANVQNLFSSMSVKHSQKTEIEMFGMSLLSLSVSGPYDKDNDGKPEVMVDLNIGGKDIYDGPIELSPAIVTSGGLPLVEAVIDGVKKLGVKIPF